MLTHEELKARALEHPDVRSEYEALEEEFCIFDEFLKARAAAGITQAEMAARIGTTQSAIARLGGGAGKALAITGDPTEVCSCTRLPPGVAAGEGQLGAIREGKAGG